MTSSRICAASFRKLEHYELKDKKGSLINFDYSDGLYTVPKQLENGYLAIGKQKVEFSRATERK
jgi:type IV secretion system protein VirB9